MSKPKSSHRVFSRAFKIGIVRRMLAGENVTALARELKFSRKDLYVWRDRFLAGGPEALRGRGRPRKAGAADLAANEARAQPPPPDIRGLSLKRRARASPNWSARSASSRWNLIFFGKPCGRSGEHASRTRALA
jgi:transposase-like protein